MRHLMHAFMATSLLLSGLTANAQFRPRIEERFDRDPGRDYGRLMDRIRIDLDRAEASTLPFTADRIRVDRALEQVNAFQRRMNAGDYDRRDLDDAIVALQRVADGNRNLSVYERDDLASDVSRMRDYQAYLDGR
jgi:hypothetical protein